MTYSTERRVEFRETDAAGIIHFTTFFGMMESAEHEMLRSLGISVMPQPSADDPSPVTWPRVAAACDFLSAARFEDLLTIQISVARLGSSSVQYRFRFSRDDAAVADGTLTVVCCKLEKGQLTKSEIPTSIRAMLESHLEA